MVKICSSTVIFPAGSLHLKLLPQGTPAFGCCVPSHPVPPFLGGIPAQACWVRLPPWRSVGTFTVGTQAASNRGAQAAPGAIPTSPSALLHIPFCFYANSLRRKKNSKNNWSLHKSRYPSKQIRWQFPLPEAFRITTKVPSGILLLFLAW